MSATQVTIGYGASFALGDTASPIGYTTLAEVFSITPPSFTTDMPEATHMQSPDNMREYIAGLTDPGECSFEMNYIPGSTADDALTALLALDPASRARSCKITFPTPSGMSSGATHVFTGILMSYEPTVPVDDRMTAAVTFKVTGPVTRTDAA